MACRWDIQYSGDHRSPCGGHLTSTAGTAETSFFCSEGQDIDFKEKSGSTCIFTGNPPGHILPSEFRFRKACFPFNKCIQ